MSGWDETPVGDDEFDIATFSSGVEKRVSVILLLDTSESMNGPKGATFRPIDQLNGALEEWAKELHDSRRLRHRAEVAIITFGNGGVQTLQLGKNEPFSPAATFVAPKLEANNVTPMIEAVQMAISLGEARKANLDTQQIMRFRPLIFMITDGEPTDAEGKPLEESGWKPLAHELADLEARKKLAFFAVGVTGARIEVLRALSPEGYWDLGQGSFTDFLKLVSASAGDADPISFARAQLAKLSANG